MPTEGGTAPETPFSHTFMSSELEGLHFWISVTFQNGQSDKRTHFKTAIDQVCEIRKEVVSNVSLKLSVFLSSHHYPPSPFVCTMYAQWHALHPGFKGWRSEQLHFCLQTWSDNSSYELVCFKNTFVSNHYFDISHTKYSRGYII